MKRGNVIALVVFVLAVTALLTLSARNAHRIQSSFLGFISPFLKTGSGWQRSLIAFHEGLKTLDQLESDNKQLLVENKRLKAENQLLHDLGNENTRLRRALEYRQRTNFNLVPAKIIARDSSTWWNTVTIDRGIDDGVEPDLPVLTEEGLVGKTTVVSKNSAVVLLLADENCKVAAKVEGTREQGIVKGERTSTTSTPQITLSFLSKNADLKPLQTVVTSGVGGVYPPGIMMGHVRDFKVRELDGFATVVPAVDFATLEDVFVVFGNK
jgi:rod shape-determining protein MreC